MISLAKILIKTVIGKNSIVGILILMALILLLGAVSQNVNIILPFKFAQDLTLTLESIALHLYVLFSAYKICDNLNLARFAMSCGMSYERYVLSIYIATVLICTIITFGFSLINLFLFAILHNTLAFELFIQTWLFCLSALFLGGIFTAMAFFTKPFNAFIYSIILFFAGSGASGILELMQSEKLNAVIANIIFWVIPNFGLFNMLGTITSGYNFNFLPYCMLAIMYFCIYYIGTFIVSIYAFKRKDL